MEYITTVEYSTSSPYTIFTFLLILLSVLWIISKHYAHKNTAKMKPPPEPSGAWPIIGHLLLLRKPQPVHITFGNIADEYGPVFVIKLGVHRILVVSRWDVAKECLTTNDKVLANRPKSSLALKILGHDFSMLGFSLYSPYWRRVRKISITELLSNNRLEMLKHIRESEVKAAIKELHDLWTNEKERNLLVDMKRWFGNISVNVILRMLVGKPLVIRGEVATSAEKKIENECRKVLRDFFVLAGNFSLGEMFPFLRWFDLDKKEKDMKRVAQVLEDIAHGWLEEHKRQRITNYVDEHAQDIENDLMGRMLSTLDNYEEVHSTYGSDRANKATCLSLTLGATDTTTTTLTWALTLLLNNYQILKKTQNEINFNVGQERQVNESDIKNLPYLQCIMKETLRLYPPVPLLLPHESMEDCIVGGYHIPAGTRVLINASKIQRDPHLWPDPDRFLPERFLTGAKDFDVRGQDFELIPFGSGRRMCPGVTLALQVMQLTLANLLHCFDIETPSDGPLDMSESSGLSSPKASQLEVLLTPRLSAELYE